MLYYFPISAKPPEILKKKVSRTSGATHTELSPGVSTFLALGIAGAFGAIVSDSEDTVEKPAPLSSLDRSVPGSEDQRGTARSRFFGEKPRPRGASPILREGGRRCFEEIVEGRGTGVSRCGVLLLASLERGPHYIERPAARGV